MKVFGFPQKRPFETQRTKQLRATKPFYADDHIISGIETCGCEVLYIEPTAAILAWAYTIGIYDTCGKPEVIAIGPRKETAHAALNEAALRLRNGVDVTQRRQSEILVGLDCEFRPVDHKWVTRLMDWALWYYGNRNFPVLQFILPDRENRFPEDKGFDESCRHPLLQPGAPFTEIEEQFWEATDVSISLSDWRFRDPPHTRVFISKAVCDDVEPITRVSHDACDGAWQFLGDSMMREQEEPLMLCLYHLIDKDPTLKQLADLPLGWWAERDKPGDRWKRHKHEPGYDN